MRQIEHDDGVIVVDETIEEKPSTDEHDITCWHYAHSNSHRVKGIPLLNFVYHRQFECGDAVSLPRAFEVIAKTQDDIDPKTGT